MSVSIQRLEGAEASEIATTIRNAGIAGAGGAGFPTHAKWERLDEVPFLLINHQESEPNYFIDKWLGKHRAETFAEFFDALLAEHLDLIVVCAKEKDRSDWMGALEAATDGSVYGPDDLPLDSTAESGVVFAYTDDKYEYGMESVLLRLVADVTLRDELPMDHGWIVQNTETMYNVYRALEENHPVTHKYLHVDGNVPNHRFLSVPVGTPASTLLEIAGKPPATLGDDETLTDGGPGWCFAVDRPPSQFGVRKRTNCVLVLDKETAAENTLGNERINVLSERSWSGEFETEPTEITTDLVRVPLISNPSFEGIVARSSPVVEPGIEVERGEMIAVPGGDGISNTQHASIDGTVTAVTENYIEIRSEQADGEAPEDEVRSWRVYWTSCDECGAYIARPIQEHFDDGIGYRCEDCR